MPRTFELPVSTILFVVTNNMGYDQQTFGVNQQKHI